MAITRAAVRNVFLKSWGPGKAEAGGLLSRLGRLPHELVTGKGRSPRPKPEVYSAAGDVSPQAGDREGPVNAHPLLGPRRWSPGRAGPQNQRDLPRILPSGGLVSRLGPGLPRRWSSRGPQWRVSGGGPHLEPHVEHQMLENAAGRKSHLQGPLVKAFIGRSLSGELPVSEETEGVCEV